jgi:hypothetical protein
MQLLNLKLNNNLLKMNKNNSNSLNTKIILTTSDIKSVSGLFNNLDKNYSKNESDNKIINKNYYSELYKKKSFDEIIKEIPHHSDR